VSLTDAQQALEDMLASSELPDEEKAELRLYAEFRRYRYALQREGKRALSYKRWRAEREKQGEQGKE
jgi:hypothetical protein